jgi:hypothetical protein
VTLSITLKFGLLRANRKCLNVTAFVTNLDKYRIALSVRKPNVIILSIIKQVALNKFNTEDFLQNTQMLQLNLKWKLFTKVIKKPSEEDWV